MELADRACVADEVTSSYVPRTLASELKSRGALPFIEVLQIAQSLAAALVALHGRDLVHRDIKPSNIIFVDGEPKLADIGLVSSASESRSFVGTEGFIPPEGPGTPQADIYSLGIVVYVLATGKHHRDFPEPPANLATRADRNQLLELTAIIHKATQTSPRDRYQSAEALLADLQRLTSGRSVKRRHSILRHVSWAWKAALAIILIIFCVLLIRHERTQRKSSFWHTENPSFEQSGTTNLEAWEAALRGRALGKTFMAGGLSNSIVEYERALALDPNFAWAWEGLANSLTLLVGKGFAHGSNQVERTRFCAQKAFDLDPSSGEALQMVATATLVADYNFARAEPMFRQSIQLKPDAAALRHNYACFLFFYGRFDEAEAMFRGVIRDRPSWGYSYLMLGRISFIRGDYDRASKELDECLRLQPTWPDGFRERFVFLWMINRQTQALSDLLRCMEMDGISTIRRDEAVLLAERAKNLTPAQTLSGLVELLESRRAERQFVSAFDLARFYALLGDKNHALDRLEEAVEEHRTSILCIKVQREFKFLANEPPFHAVLRRLQLER
jgi:tetratricopeptide (TPR) repeat protein